MRLEFYEQRKKLAYQKKKQQETSWHVLKTLGNILKTSWNFDTLQNFYKNFTKISGNFRISLGNFQKSDLKMSFTSENKSKTGAQKPRF